MQTPRIEVAGAPEATAADIPVNAHLIAAQLKDVLLRVDQVASITTLSVPTIYRLISAGQFPKPYNITVSPAGAKAWRLSDINNWIEALGRTELTAA